MLTSDQRRALRRTAASPRTPARVARRARLVLDADAQPQGASSTRTARLWLQRYLDRGVDGLSDAPRAGRPSCVTDSVRERVLTEPLFAASPKWTSRMVAEAAGVSQSTVVRLWGEVYDPGVLRETATWPGLRCSYRLTGVLLDAGGAILVLRRTRSRRADVDDDGDRRDETAFAMRSPLRRPLQTLLAADLLTPRVPATHDGDDTVARFLDAATADGGGDHLVLCRTAHAEAARIRARGEVVALAPEHWQALLAPLGSAMAPACLPAVEEAAHRIREWAQRPASTFCWTASTARQPAAVPASPRLPTRSYLSESQRLAESVAAAIQDGVNAGRLLGGERVTEPFLMRATHASRSQVRDALRSLASDGLVELRSGRSAVVPTPTVEDVLETYSIRRALGHLVVGSAASCGPGELAPALTAFDNLLRIAAQGDVRATDDADLDFQDAVAACVPLRRVPTMFRRITMQLRLFISVMGLDYAYSIDDIVTDDSAILDAVRDHDAAAAQQLWKQKMDAAVRYMVRQLASGGSRTP